MEKRYRLSAVSVSAAEVVELAAQAEPNGRIASRIVVTGKCPRCRHEVNQPIIRRAWVLDRAPAGAELNLVESNSKQTMAIGVDLASKLQELLASQGPVGQDYLVVQCNCGTEHASGKRGCGAWWGLSARWQSEDEGPASVQLSPGVRPTGYDIQEEEQRDALGKTELERLRAAAGNWRTGLAALLVLLPTLVVVKGNDTIKNLSVDDQHHIGLLIAVGSVFAVIAALCAMRAAYGPLQQQDLDAKDLASIREDEVTKILDYLQATRIMSIVAVILLALAIAVTWSAPSSDPAFIKVTKVTDNVSCGTYVSGTSVELSVKSPGGAEAIQLPEIKKVEWVTAC